MSMLVPQARSLLGQQDVNTFHDVRRLPGCPPALYQTAIARPATHLHTPVHTYAYIHTHTHTHARTHMHTRSVIGTIFAAVGISSLCQVMLFSLITPSQGKSALAYGVESGEAALVSELLAAKADPRAPVTEVGWASGMAQDSAHIDRVDSGSRVLFKADMDGIKDMYSQLCVPECTR